MKFFVQLLLVPVAIISIAGYAAIAGDMTPSIRMRASKDWFQSETPVVSSNFNGVVVASKEGEYFCVLTAAHCLLESNSVFVEHNGRWYEAQELGHDVRHDLALFIVRGDFRGVSWVKILDGILPVGTEAYYRGFLTQGDAKFVIIPGRRIRRDESPCYCFSFKSVSGMSGGPVIYNGNRNEKFLVGILSNYVGEIQGYSDAYSSIVTNEVVRAFISHAWHNAVGDFTELEPQGIRTLVNQVCYPGGQCYPFTTRETYRNSPRGRLIISCPPVYNPVQQPPVRNNVYPSNPSPVVPAPARPADGGLTAAINAHDHRLANLERSIQQISVTITQISSKIGEVSGSPDSAEDRSAIKQMESMLETLQTQHEFLVSEIAAMKARPGMRGERGPVGSRGPIGPSGPPGEPGTVTVRIMDSGQEIDQFRDLKSGSAVEVDIQRFSLDDK